MATLLQQQDGGYALPWNVDVEYISNKLSK